MVHQQLYVVMDFLVHPILNVLQQTKQLQNLVIVIMEIGLVVMVVIQMVLSLEFYMEMVIGQVILVTMVI